MKKKWIFGVLMAVVALLLLEAALAGSLMRRYPQRVIMPEELYGTRLENLHDFILDEQGNLTAQSSDPWVTFNFDQEMNVRHITVQFAETDETWRMGIYLLPTYERLQEEVRDSRCEITLASGQSRYHLQGLRFDLTSQDDATFRVEKVVLNSTWSLVKMMALTTLQAAGILLLLAAEIWLWIKVLRRERPATLEAGRAHVWWIRRLIPLAVQLALLVSLMVVLFWRLIGEDGGDYSRPVSYTHLSFMASATATRPSPLSPCSTTCARSAATSPGSAT